LVEIRKVRIRLVEMKLKVPFETSFGRTHVRKAIIVELEGESEVGYGECPAGEDPFYSYETWATAWHIMEDFIVPRVLGREFHTPEELLQALKRIRGHNMAKTGFEEALWDLLGKLEGKSVAKLLGGVKSKIESGVSIGIKKDIETLLRTIGDYLDKGYRRIKIKIKPGWDVEVVRRIRSEFPKIPLMVDANGAYTLDDMPVFKELDRFGLMMIEQPLSYDDLVDHAELQSKVRTPICLDESISSVSDLKAGLKLGSLRILNIKPARVGGLSVARVMHDICAEKGIPVWCGGMLETGIGRAHNVALASLPNFKLPNDISASDRYYEQDIVEPPFTLNPDGTIDVPKGPGIGVEVLHEVLERYTKKDKLFVRG